MKAYQAAAMEASAIEKELKSESGLDMAEATSQIIQMKLLEAVKNIGPDEFDDMDLDKLFSAVRKNAQSQVQIARVKLEYERGYNKGLFRATEVVESEARKAGLTEENIDIIKRRILALKEDASEEE